VKSYTPALFHGPRATEPLGAGAEGGVCHWTSTPEVGPPEITLIPLTQLAAGPAICHQIFCVAVPRLIVTAASAVDAEKKLRERRRKNMNASLFSEIDMLMHDSFDTSIVPRVAQAKIAACVD
jgi:hypothetical protein